AAINPTISFLCPFPGIGTIGFGADWANVKFPSRKTTARVFIIPSRITLLPLASSSCAASRGMLLPTLPDSDCAPWNDPPTAATPQPDPYRLSSTRTGCTASYFNLALQSRFGHRFGTSFPLGIQTHLQFPHCHTVCCTLSNFAMGALYMLGAMYHSSGRNVHHFF